MRRKNVSPTYNDTNVSKRELPRGDELLRLSKLALDVAADPCMWGDTVGCIVYANEAACRILGYTKDELLSMRVSDFDTYYDEKRYSQALDEVKRTGSLKAETVYVRKDGGRFPVEISVYILENEYLGNFIRDITERKQAEEALRKSEEKFRLVADFTYDWESWIGPDCDFIYVSPSCKRITGHDPGEFYRDPKLMVAVVHPDDRAAYERHIGAYFAKTTGSDSIDFRIVTPQGETRWINHVCQPVFGSDGNWLGRRASNRDITERKQVEEALGDSEEKYRFLVENSKDVIWKIDLTERWTFVSGNVGRVNGYKPDEMVGKPIWDFIAPECHDFIKEKMLKRMRGEDIAPYVTWSINKDGRRTPLEVVTTSIIDENGKIVGVQGISRDITLRMQAEEALQESERRYRGIVEDQTELIALLDIDLMITFVNDAYCRYFGKKREELVGHTFLTLISEADREAVKASIAGLSKKNPADSIEQRVKRPDGSLSWMDWKNRIVFDEHGRPTGYQAVGRDITERKRAEEALVKEKHILTKSQEAAHVGNWAYDLETREVTGSGEVYRIFRYEPGDVKISREWVRSHVLPEDLSILDNFMGARVRDGKQGSVDYRIKRRDGSVGYVNTIVDKSVRDKAGRIRRLYGIIQDVTERKQAEEEMKVAKQQSELYLDLMGHDINNMHQVALGYLELASAMPPGDEQAKLLEKPVEVLQRSTQLIHNVRKLQKLKEGVFQTKAVDVCEVLREVQREFGAVPNKAITLNTNRCGQCLVRANELLYDVFANLVSNAIKHTGDRADIVIDMDILKDNNRKYCRVMVEDDGPGIPEDFKGKIFNRMLRGTTKAKGMGLGLYLVKSLVDSYGGRIWVEDRINGDHTKGARFVVMLPAV